MSLKRHFTFFFFLLSCLGLETAKDLSVFESSCHLPTCLPHTAEASHCPFNCGTSRCPGSSNIIRCKTIDSLFCILERDLRRKREEDWRKNNFTLVAKGFCGHSFLTDLVRHIPITSKLWKKMTLIWRTAYFRTSEPWRKKDKTVAL